MSIQNDTWTVIKVSRDVADLIKSWSTSMDDSYDRLLRKKFGLSQRIINRTRKKRKNNHERSNH